MVQRDSQLGTTPSPKECPGYQCHSIDVALYCFTFCLIGGAHINLGTFVSLQQHQPLATVAFDA